MVAHKSLQVAVDVQDEVQEKGDEFHGTG
jgi:hypothetical protein